MRVGGRHGCARTCGHHVGTDAIIRCRELLGDEADALSDDEVRKVARHAEAMARILIALALRDGRIH